MHLITSTIKELKKVRNLVFFNFFMDKKFTRKHFHKTQNYPLNLDNPKSFNEKIQWLKFFDNTSIKSRCSDKLAVREHIEQVIGKEYLIPLYHAYSSSDELLVEALPDKPFIIKTNHGCGGVFIIKSKSNIDLASIKSALDKQLSYSFYHALREPQYKSIPPRILVEKLLLDKKDNIPADYKIHCFNGKPTYIEVATERFIKHAVIVYNTQWQALDVKWKFPMASQQPQPKNLPQMLEIAEKLSKEFIYVRVDLYNVDGQIYFGELTFTPGAGFSKFEQYQTDLAWGKLIQLPINHH